MLVSKDLSKFSEDYLVSKEVLIKNYEDSLGLDVKFKDAFNKSRFLNMDKIDVVNLNVHSPLIKKIMENPLNTKGLYEDDIKKVSSDSKEYLTTAYKLFEVLSKLSKNYSLVDNRSVEDLFLSGNTNSSKICIVGMLSDFDSVCGIDFIAKEIEPSTWVRASKQVSDVFGVDFNDFILTTKYNRFQIIFRSENKNTYVSLLNDISKGYLVENNLPKVVLGHTFEDTLLYTELDSVGVHIYGSTGSGKSTMINTILKSLKYLNDESTFEIEQFSGEGKIEGIPFERIDFVDIFLSKHTDKTPNQKNKLLLKELSNMRENSLQLISHSPDSILNRLNHLKSFRGNLLKTLGAENFTSIPYKVIVIDEFNFSEYDEKDSVLNAVTEFQNVAKELRVFFITSSHIAKRMPFEYESNLKNIVVLKRQSFEQFKKHLDKDQIQEYHSMLSSKDFSIVKQGDKLESIKLCSDFINM